MKPTATFLEDATYDTIKRIAETATDADLLKMLTRVNQTLPLLESSSFYSRVEKDMRTNRTDLVAMRDNLVTRSNLDTNLMIWIIGLRTALEFHDFDAMHLQLCMFIISQRDNLLRIEDDKLRLITTYFHFSLTANLLQKGLI